MKFPGFVDLQINGYKGVDFSGEKLTEQDFQCACREIIGSGTVVFLPTIITSSAGIYQKNLKIIASVLKSEPFRKHIPGIHVEGPFISKEDGARGAHSKEWVKEPDINLLNQLQEWAEGNIKILTIAAELKGAKELCRRARKIGIKVSLGHQLANAGHLERLQKAGAKALTHLGNGLPMMIHRHENPLLAGLANEELKAMLITDGHHIPASLIKLIFKVKGISNTIVVSDAAPVAGLPPGKYYTLGNEAILDPSGKLYNPQNGYLVGSSSSLLECMNYLLSLNFLSVDDLMNVGTYNPLKLIGVDIKEFENQFQPMVEMRERFVLI